MRVSKFKNAQIVIQQLKNGEWEFHYNRLVGRCCTAHREGRGLWVSNGAWFVDVDGTNAFGFVFRHWVWWAAARKARLQADKRLRPVSNVPKLYE